MYVTQKQFSYCVVICITVFAYLAILRSPLLYFDDSARVYTYLAIDQGVHGRPFADFIYLFLTGGLFVDFSPMSQILALVCMVVAAFLLYECFFKNILGNGKYINIERSLFVLVFSVFPLNYSIISFRFDSFSFGIAILLASVAFVKTTTVKIICKKDIRHLLLSAVLLAISLASYQVMFGIYTCCTVLYLSNMLLNNENFKAVLFRLFVYIFVCAVSVLFYSPIIIYSKYMVQFGHYGLAPHSYAKLHMELPNIYEFLPIVFSNMCTIFSTLKSYLNLNVPSVVFVCVNFVFVCMVLTKKIDILKKIIVILMLPCAIVMSFGMQIFLVHPVVEPRTFFPIAIFAALIFGFTLFYAKRNFHKIILLVVVTIFVITSSSILSSIGNAQRDQFKFESEIVYNGLEADIMHLYESYGLKSLYIVNNEPHVCTTLQVLKKKYGFLKFCRTMSADPFKIVAYLPIKYDLPALALPRSDFLGLKTFIDKYSYSIKQVEEGRFVVILKDVVVPPFTPERWE